MSGKSWEQRVRERAYFLSQQAGFPLGKDLDFWAQASQSEPRWSWPTRLWTWLGRLRAWLSNQKDALSTIQAVVTMSALGVGAWWTWLLLDPVAQWGPNLFVTQTAETRKLGQDLLLLHINLLLENTGKVTAHLTCAAFIVSPVTPARDEELKPLSSGARDELKAPYLDWPVIKWKVDDSLADDDFFVEVGNKAQYTVDFVIPDSTAEKSGEKLRAVQIYSNFQRTIPGNSKCRRKLNGGIEGPGWPTTTLYDIPI
jgi:hypothetical protein